MNNFYRSCLAVILILFLTATVSFAQTTISGSVKDVNGESIAGANIVVKGRVVGTISNAKGEFSLKVSDAPPLTLVFSFVGYGTQEVTVNEATTTNLEVKLEEQTILGQEVVVSASR
jgi:iron complex outermembrane recepter protein